jgi:hypothetical protein
VLKGSLRRVVLHGYIELKLSGVWGRVKLAVRADVECIRLCANCGVFLAKRRNG